MRISRFQKLRIFGFLLAAASLGGLIVFFLSEPHRRANTNPDDKLSITLVLNRFSQNLEVPVKYLGPGFLRLSKANRLGGKQEQLLIEFYYPSVLPLTPENKKLGREETIVYASLSTGIPGGIRRFGLARTSPDTSSYVFSGNEVCGLKEFKTTSKFLSNTYYYYHNEKVKGDTLLETEEDNVYSGDVFFICSFNGRQPSYCRLYTETPRGLAVLVNHVPEDAICAWSDVAGRLRSLVDSFVK